MKDFFQKPAEPKTESTEGPLAVGASVSQIQTSKPLWEKSLSSLVNKEFSSMKSFGKKITRLISCY
jgi:hypothetical protein